MMIIRYENSESERMNMQYNICENKIEKSDNPFNEISFSEKCFLPLDYNTYFIIPNFNRRSPSIIYYYKNRNIIECSSYHPNHRLKPKPNKYKTAQIKQYFEGLELDMPNPNSESDIISNKDNNITSNFVVNPAKIRENLNVSNTSNYKTTNNINENHEIIKENLSVKVDSINGHQSEQRYTKISQENEIKQEDSQEKKTNEEVKTEVIEQNKEKEEVKTEVIEQKKEKEEEPNNENKNNESNVENKPENKEPENPKPIEQKKEIEIVTKNKNTVKILTFDNIKPLEKYHSSLDVRLKNINNNAIKRKNKMRKIVLPKKIDQKSLKKMVRKINKFEFNEFEENSNY